MKYPLTCAAAVGLCAACTVEVTDSTPSPFSYDPPINEQIFRVAVRSDRDIEGVEFNSPAAGMAPMTAMGLDTYETRVPVPICASAIDFSVRVTIEGLLDSITRTFPEAGRFTHQITGLPTECAAFTDRYGQTFVVDRQRDFPDMAPGDGVCRGVVPQTGGSQTGCSLRAAVMEANAKPGVDLIRVPTRRHRLTRDGREGPTEVNDSVRDLDITESVTIEGMGDEVGRLIDILQRSSDPDDDLTDNGENSEFARIDGNQQQRIFHVAGPGVVLRLRHIALLHGNEPGPGGAILNKGTLGLERVVFAQNRARTSRDAPGGGGAVQNDGTLVGEDVAFAQNFVRPTVINAIGGAVYNGSDATLTLKRSLMAYNDARFGAALQNYGTATLENVTIYKNRYTEPTPANSIVSNEAGVLRLAYATIAKQGETGMFDEVRWLLANGGGRFELRNSLLVNNTVRGLCVGSITSIGGNVIDGDCAFGSSSTPLAPDHQSVGGPDAYSLIHRGGFLPVVSFDAPFDGSTAFDARDLGKAPPYPFTDQRGAGFGRRVDGNGDGTAEPDPGAFEYTP